MAYFLLFIIAIWVFYLQIKVNDLGYENQLAKENFKKEINDINKQINEMKSGNIVNQDHSEEVKDIEEVKEEVVFEQKEQPIFEEKEVVVPKQLAIDEEPKKEKISPLSETQNFNFEKLFLGNIFNKIGAIALIIGIGIFLKLVIWQTPTFKILSSFIIGILMLFASIKIHKDELKKYSEVLMGTGFGILFITTYCSCTLYDVLSVPTAMSIGVLLVIATNFVAQKYNSFSTILIGLFGGYLNPFFICPDISPNFLFAYFIFINIIGMVYINKNQDKNWINSVNLLLTTLVLTIHTLFYRTEISIALPFSLWGIYIFYDFINPQREIGNKNFLAWENYLCLIWFVNYIYKFENKMLNCGILLGIGLIYAICAYFINKKSYYVSKIYTYEVLLSTGFAVLFIDNSLLRYFCWIAEIFVILFVSKKYNLQFIINWCVGFLSIASIQSVFLGEEYHKVICSILCVLIAIFIYKKYDVKSIEKWNSLFFIMAIINIFCIDNQIAKIAVLSSSTILFYIISKLSKINFVKNWGLIYLSSSFIPVFEIDTLFGYYTILFNERTLTFAIPILTAVLADYLFYKKDEFEKDVIKILYLSFIYLWAIFEVISILNITNFDSSFNKAMAVITICLLYSINMNIFGNKSSNKTWKILGYATLSLSLLFLFVFGKEFTPIDSFIPVLNIRCLTFIIAIGTCLIFGNSKYQIVKDLFQYLSAILGAYLVIFETNDYLTSNSLEINIVLSSALLLYAGILMTLGIFKNIKAFKITGIWITIISVLKIVFFDLANIETVYKLAEFIILGCILLLVSFFYTKKKNEKK